MDKILTDFPIIETKRFLLRNMKPEDAAEMFVFMANRETMKFITPHPVESIEEVEADIKSSMEKYQLEKEIPWVIVDRNTDEVIGSFRFHKLNFWHKKAEMGVVIRKEDQNSGVMTEVLEKMLAFGFDTLGLNRIVGDIFAGNKGSEKLLMKYGFQKEGQLRQTDFDGSRYHDTVVYSLLKSEYDKEVAQKVTK